MTTQALLITILIARAACYLIGFWLCFKILFRYWAHKRHVPILWTLPSLFAQARTVATESQVKPGAWIPCRPHASIESFRFRLRCAWLAFSGKCDLVRWPEGQ